MFGTFSKSLPLRWKVVHLVVHLEDMVHISILEKANTDPLEMRHIGSNCGRWLAHILSVAFKVIESDWSPVERG